MKQLSKYGGLTKMVWARNGTPDTLTSAGTELLISDLTSTIFNTLLTHVIFVTSFVQPGLQLGNGSIDTGTNYAARFSYDGATDTTVTTQPYILFQSDTSPLWDQFAVQYSFNISAEEKLVISNNIGGNTVGAGNAPHRQEVVGKWSNTSNQFDQVKNDDVSCGTNYDTDSQLSMLSTD